MAKQLTSSKPIMLNVCILLLQAMLMVSANKTYDGNIIKAGPNLRKQATKLGNDEEYCRDLENRPCPDVCGICYTVQDGMEMCHQLNTSSAQFKDILMSSIPLESVTLEIHNCKVVSLKSEMFYQFRQLHSLSASFCDVSHIEDNLFGGLSSIEKLDFILHVTSYVQNLNITSDLFTKMSTLQSLKIAPHVNLTNSSFDTKSLLCALNQLKLLSLTYFCNLAKVNLNVQVMPSMQHLNFSKNILQLMPDIASFPNLRILDIFRNQRINDIRFPRVLTTANLTINYSANTIEIAKDTFRNYSFLKSFSVIGLDMLDGYASGGFLTLKNVTFPIIDVHGNKRLQLNFPEFGLLMLKDLHNLNVTMLDLSLAIVLKTEQLMFFSSLKYRNLEKLYIQGNTIPNFVYKSFYYLPNLVELNASNISGLQNIGDTLFPPNSKLKILDFSDNPSLKTGEGSIGKIFCSLNNSAQSGESGTIVNDQLEKFSLANTGTWNYLGKYKFLNLIYFDMSNVIIDCEKEINSYLELPKVKQLFLQKVKFTKECFSVVFGNEIEVLNLHNFDKKCLMQLWLKNKFQDKNLKKLTHLHLSGIPNLTSENLTTIFKRLPNLKFLDISSNEINEIHPTTFQFLCNIKYIDLSSNLLQKLKVDSFHSNQLLNSLDLSNNRINHIDPEGFKRLDKLQYINFAQNKFVCNCELRPFQQWLKKNRGSPNIKVIVPTCYSPLNLGNCSVIDYKLDWFECDGIILKISISGGAVLILVLICIMLLLYYRIDIKYYYHFRRRRKQYQPIPGANLKYDAFICYNAADREWVIQTLYKELEKGQDEFKLSIHDLDFEVGKPIIDNIYERMSESRHIVMVISHEFLKSEWCRFETDVALNMLVECGKNKFIILIFLEDIVNRDLPKKLSLFKRHVTYSQWPHKDGREREKFWKNLKLAIAEDGENFEMSV